MGAESATVHMDFKVHVVHNVAVIRKAILIWIISRIAKSVMKRAFNPRRRYQ
jgi:hypothetical protein